MLPLHHGPVTLQQFLIASANLQSFLFSASVLSKKIKFLFFTFCLDKKIVSL
ncbi:hypothetical protein DK150_90005 [Flavobacterium psychrophilum]|nr:hypothetical protein DK150_90005 [Flavobacterium psychrophilum]